MGKSINYQIEQFSSWYKEAESLMIEHWREIYPDKQYYSPQYEFGLALEKMDGLLCFTARTESKELIGYGIFVVVPNPRNGKVIAENYSFYLAKEYRKGFTGIHFLAFCINGIERDYREPKNIRFYVTPQNDFSNILTRMAFIETEKVLERAIPCPQQ